MAAPVSAQQGQGGTRWTCRTDFRPLAGAARLLL